MTEAIARWGDLKKRAISAAFMLAVGAGELWLGGTPFSLLVIALTGVMFWELANMTAPGRRRTPLAMGLFAAACLAGAELFRDDLATTLLILPGLALALSPRRDRQIATVYGIAIMVAGYGLIELRTPGMPAILWLVAIVIVSDVMGYFVGRIVGGPKFWPAISPKKTWSGTVAGWVGAIGVSLIFVATGHAPWMAVALAPFVAFAGQLGDIVESWIKRRSGVKDSSTLIPGHGGFLDRFDALIGAVGLVMLLGLFTSLPMPGPLGG
ncbi:phosphatidate cytidylyltransferase [Pseudotabrizicola sediminis]|uniref:Phosphatidate cytidylyltransferase n=1 Tax=Pseudotabrizicola sediminis TaxID=2486418 RepID=A0ABY2KUV5_9RHOB|nr:phosphatidate cytidylyltransferase [Pseudotabrizicola sediminis]TGD45226.1 phosphatidate cytidylyltransferase [Pseudotabrizicola sediminis]